MKVNLDVKSQNLVFAAFNQMDGREEVSVTAQGPKLMRVPYRLGAERRAVVRNLIALKASLEAYEKTRQSVFKEVWPDALDGAEIKKEDDPKGTERFQATMKEIEEKQDAFDLLPISDSVAYEQGNEFPNLALSILEEHGLISQSPAPPVPIA